MIVILTITLAIELALYMAHRGQRDTARRALERAYERAARRTVAHAPAPMTYADWQALERATDDRRAVVGKRSDVGAVWNSNPRYTR